MYRLPEIRELRDMRLKLGWSQSDLAKKSDVARSLINKMEAGVRSRSSRDHSDADRGSQRRKRVPNYESVKKITECMASALAQRFRDQDGTPIGKICSWNLESVDMRHPIEKARNLMSHKSYSQLPVFDGDELCGRVTYKSLLGFMLEGDGTAGIWRHRIMDHRDIVGPLHPCVAEWVLAGDVPQIVAREGAILVMRKGQIKGIATDDDFLKLLGPQPADR